MSEILSNLQKTDIRRHLGIPAAGYPTAGVVGGIRSVQSVGQLENMMAGNLQLQEECVLTGYPYAIVQIAGNVQIGNTVTITVNNNPVTYTVTLADFGPSNSPLYYGPIPPLQSVGFKTAAAINAANLGPLAAGGANYGSSPPVTLPDHTEIALTAPTTFTVTASAVGLGTVVVANGSTYPNPQIAVTNPDGTQNTIYGWIQICNALEAQVVQPNLSLRYEVADVVKFRRDEVAARLQAYRWACQSMGNFLSVGFDLVGMVRKVGSNSAFRIVV